MRLPSTQPAGNEKGNAAKRQRDSANGTTPQNGYAERDERNEGYC
ncbi:hypothetical protein C8N24_6399 [Solirubrobacter pauli]|uniref:Uncharacterized protein n=1 Tax=Solirubrobacter pauli TaxID=166793 RepID=A0A660L347_9ACTN|nr:hypothetical protein [Solirubrobacter pauli]RKQ88357.1 hypothetical protein C8N24_6399 [Solirubrobacter pauli]